MHETYRASVVVPTYKRIELLRLLLQSLAPQRLERGEFELIIADDGSGEEVASLARQFQEAFSRLIYITGPNSGPGVARNRGAAAATSPVLAFIDSDCLASSKWVESITSAVELGADLAHGPVQSSVASMRPFVHSFDLPAESVCAANFAISRRCFDQLGGFNQRVSWDAEDREFFARSLSAGLKPRFVSQAVVFHMPQLRTLSLTVRPTPRTRRVYQSQRELLDLVPGQRSVFAAENRRSLFKGLLKICLLVLPAVIFPSSPQAWATGYGAEFLYGVLKGVTANRVLKAAGEPLQVPLRSMITYGLLFPFVDLVTLAQRAVCGMGVMRG
jgi:glycosyltransferase involved in cell wall biosynthesis